MLTATQHISIPQAKGFVTNSTSQLQSNVSEFIILVPTYNKSEIPSYILSIYYIGQYYSWFHLEVSIWTVSPFSAYRHKEQN
jgi:hypothetical protein